MRSILTLSIFLLFSLIPNIYGHSQKFKTVNSYKQYLLENIERIDFIEGIWQFDIKINSGMAKGRESYPTIYEPVPEKVVIMKGVDNQYFTYVVDVVDRISAKDYIDYHFQLTAVEGQYLFNESNNCNGKAYVKPNGDLYFECKKDWNKDGWRYWNYTSITATKISLNQSEIKSFLNPSKKEAPVLKPEFSYGTGALLSDDLIITCYHVIKDGKQILIRGIKGRFDTTYSAKLNFYDEDLDIAILKISSVDPLKILNIPPYPIRLTSSEVGESVFVLGYPLLHTMGQEIKLTTGVISSNSGFRGDTTLFQISAPVQPGNSGGPLFDSKGSLIGIVSAKHKNADNVGYAVKLGQLAGILKLKGIKQPANKPLKMDLTKKVKLFKDYIYSIEVVH